MVSLDFSDPTFQLVLFAALAFYIVSSPRTYQLTNAIFGKLGVPFLDWDDEPTTTGRVAHTLVFAALLYFFGLNL